MVSAGRKNEQKQNKWCESNHSATPLRQSYTQPAPDG